MNKLITQKIRTENAAAKASKAFQVALSTGADVLSCKAKSYRAAQAAYDAAAAYRAAGIFAVETTKAQARHALLALGCGDDDDDGYEVLTAARGATLHFESREDLEKLIGLLDAQYLPTQIENIECDALEMARDRLVETVTGNVLALIRTLHAA